MEETILQLITSLANLATHYKVASLTEYAGLAMLIVRFLRTDEVQEVFPERFKWPKKSFFGKLWALAASVIVTGVGALLTGVSLPVLLPTVIPVAVMSILTHKATQALGGMVHEVAKEAGRNVFQRIFDFILPPSRPEEK